MSYEEKRIRVKNYGVIPKKSPLLVEIPGTGKKKTRRLHKLAAAAFNEMAEAVKNELDIELRVASAWRRHRWRSWEHYEQYVTKKYGSVREGRKWLAYNSPHETGLAVDFGVGGLKPSKATRKQQMQTPLFNWLKENAYRFGWHPYKREPWHWEFPLSKRAWETGEGDEGDAGEPSEIPAGLGGARGYAGPTAFSDEDGVEIEFEVVEEMGEDDVAWFSGDDEEELEADEPQVTVGLPRKGEISGEIELGDGQGIRLSFNVRWSLGD